MFKIVLLIGGAGLAGTLLRYAVYKMLSAADQNGFPFGTLAVNIIGAFAAGFLFIYCRTHWQKYDAYLPILFVGFLGAFTTFSTFALESVRFLADAQYGKFLANVLLQNLTGLGAAWGGLQLAKKLFYQIN